MKITVVSGGFDPLHSGHISYLKDAKNFGSYLIVLLNSDDWLKQKKGKFLLPFLERKIILENIKYVDEVMEFEDDELGSCINGLKNIKKKFNYDELVFCDGGDRTKKNIPEMSVENVNFKFNVGGGDKKNSSSEILKKWNFNKENRIWGSFYDLFVDKNVKVKELIIKPEQGMSFQRHFHRNEFWLISEGSCVVKHGKNSDEGEGVHDYNLKKEDFFFVKKGEWHQIINNSKKTCKIIEIQYGDKVEESDIERSFYYDKKK